MSSPISSSSPSSSTLPSPAPGPSRPSRTAGLVLAAGAGRRMGAPKATVVLGGRRLVDRQVELLLTAGCDPLVVVLGSVVVDVPGAQVVANPAWAQGMGTSLAAGLRHLAVTAPGAVGAVVVVLVDQPLLSPDAVRRVAGPVRAGSARAARATYGGRPGHPVALSREVWEDVADSSVGDAGARGWLARHDAEVLRVVCDGLGDDRDADSRDDLADLADPARDPAAPADTGP